MLFQFYKNNQWNNINTVGDNEIFYSLDGYSGSENTVFFRLKNELGDLKRSNVMLRLVELYNGTEYGLVKSDNSVAASGGNPKLDGKISYSIKNAVTLNDLQSGVTVVPDENGFFRLGDLEQGTGEFLLAVTVKSESRVLLSFGELLKVSDIFFYFSATTN